MHPLKGSIKNFNKEIKISINLWTFCSIFQLIFEQRWSMRPFKSSIKDLVDKAQGKARQWILIFSLEDYFGTWNLVFNSMLSKGRVKKILNFFTYHANRVLFELSWTSVDCIVWISMDCSMDLCGLCRLHFYGFEKCRFTIVHCIAHSSVTLSHFSKS